MLFRSFKVTLNGTLISGQSGQYAYKAFFDTILNNDREDGKTLLSSEGWYNGLDPPDGALTANQLDITHADFAALSAGEKEVMLNMRTEYVRIREKERTYIFRPYNELFYLSKLLPPGVAINIQISLNSPTFYFLEYRGNEGVSLTSGNFNAELVLCHVTPMVYLTRSLTQKMMKTNTTFPTVRSEIRSYPLANTTRNFTIDNPFSGRIPNLLIVGMVRADAYNGTNNRHPFLFQKFNLTYCKQFIKGEEYPYSTLMLTRDDTSDVAGYDRFMEATGCKRKRKVNMVQPSEWGHGKGCSLIAFDNTANGERNSRVLNPRLSGSHRLEFLFSANQGANITIILYAEFENILNVTESKAVLYDVTAGATPQ